MVFFYLHRVVQPSPLSILGHFHHRPPQRNPIPSSNHAQYLLFPQPQETTEERNYFLSFSISLPVLDISYKWSHMVFVLL